MSNQETPEFETPSGDVVKAPNWPKGAPQINGPRTAEPSNNEDKRSERTRDAAQE